MEHKCKYCKQPKTEAQMAMRGGRVSFMCLECKQSRASLGAGAPKKKAKKVAKPELVLSIPAGGFGVETDRTTPGEHGTDFAAALVCRECHSILSGGEFGIALQCFCGAQEALAELVELKRIKDAGGPFPPEYERRKLLAWQTAFRVCGVIGEPKA